MKSIGFARFPIRTVLIDSSEIAQPDRFLSEPSRDHSTMNGSQAKTRRLPIKSIIRSIPHIFVELENACVAYLKKTCTVPRRGVEARRFGPVDRLDSRRSRRLLDRRNPKLERNLRQTSGCKKISFVSAERCKIRSDRQKGSRRFGAEIPAY
jgi:hypothetical protein